MKITAIIQARMTSTRLPGKVLADLMGKPLLYVVCSRARKAHNLDLVAVATTNNPADDGVQQLCEQLCIPCFRGDENDVLDRYYQASKQFDADVIVRLTADCPLLDPSLIDKVIDDYRSGDFDYVSNTLQPTYPDGLDIEVFSRHALERAWREAKLKSEREHVTPYIWKQPALFKTHNVSHGENLSGLRWTVDEPQDLDFVRRIYGHMGVDSDFGMNDVLTLLKARPELSGINTGFERNEGYQKSLREDKKGSKDAARGAGQKLYLKAKTRIPGGTQLLSKRPEMHLPDLWPSYYSKAKGVEVWDLDGNRYIDMCYNGIGACVLGAADPDVDAAVRAAIESGSMSTLNAPEEVELADLLCTLHPWAEMVRYARCGGEAMAIAVRIARAKTQRDRVAFCGYHGWHDWYLAANLAEESALDGHLLPGLEPLGVPRGLLGTALPFRYNHLEELKAIVSRHESEIAAIVMEPVRDHDPEPSFLENIQDIASQIGAVLIFDEITSGLRLNTGGAHLLYGVYPDIAVFAKAISNGYPMAAIIGNANVMQAAQNTFISSTYWTERIGPAAALATLRKHQRCNVANHLIRMGARVRDGWRQNAQAVGIELEIGGITPLGHFSFPGELKQVAKTLFIQLMLQRGFLASTAFYATYSHQEEHLEKYFAAVQEAFSCIAQSLHANTIKEQLKGPIAHTGFRRLT
jgi:glutamate-1-semialdehyde 2,1-aminomutase